MGTVRVDANIFFCDGCSGATSASDMSSKTEQEEGGEMQFNRASQFVGIRAIASSGIHSPVQFTPE